MERVVHRALERHPEARHPSMADFEEDLLRAQQAAGLQTSWDDLEPPTRLRDQRARHKAAPQKSGVSLTGWGVLAAGALLALTTFFFWPRAEPTQHTPVSALSAASTPTTSTSATSLPNPEAAASLSQLLSQVNQAVARGHFVYPTQTSALDLLRRIDAAHPGNAKTPPLRQGIMKLLEDSARRLSSAGLHDLAQTLFQESRLFLPSGAVAATVRATAEKTAGSKQAKEPPDAQGESKSKTPRLSELAWLLSQVQLSVAEGRYLRPPQNNALHFLNRLKVADPLGRRSAEAKRVMTGNLRREADTLWKNSDEKRAQALYKIVLFLDPQDGLARTRSHFVPPGAPSPAAPQRAARTSPKITREQIATAKNRIQEGNRWLRMGRLEQAEKSFQAAISAAPKQVEAMAGLATVAFERAQYTKAVELARTTLTRDRRRPDTYLLLGDAYFKLIRLKDAQRAWRQVLQLDPGNTKAQRRIERMQQQDRDSHDRAPL